jgi:imidazoleglycerol-phosphate dehydratase
MLTLFSKHGLFDLKVRVQGDIEVDFHHTIEDTGIVIGECMREALGTKEGISRYGSAYLPMDETLARVVVDLSNRPHLEFRAPAGTPSAPNMPFTLVEEFCRAVASNLRANIHVELLYGRDGHHIAEAIFKGLARALREACGVPLSLQVLGWLEKDLSADEIASVAGIATFPLVPLMTVATALRENLKVLAEQKSSKNLPRPVMAHNPFIDFIGFGQVEELQKTYLRAS